MKKSNANSRRRNAVVLAAILAVTGIAVPTMMFTGCKDGPTDPTPQPEQPQNRTAIINLSFDGNDYTATVKGNLLSSQWEGVADRFESAINSVYASGNPMIKSFFDTVFSANGIDVTIILEDNVTYASYEADNRKTVRFSINYLSGATDLEEKIKDAVSEMHGLADPIVKAKINANKGWERMNRQSIQLANVRTRNAARQYNG